MKEDRKHQYRMYWLHALEPTHIGAGRGIGFIDLPIVREGVTNWPFAPGSAVKGVWADSYGADEAARDTNDGHRLAFGKASNDNSSNAGSLQITDARLVALPVKSLYGTFGWVSCPLALARLYRDLQKCGLASGLSADISLPRQADATTTGMPALVPHAPASYLADAGAAYLGELDFACEPDQEVTKWAAKLAEWLFGPPVEDSPSGEGGTERPPDWGSIFKERFIVVGNEAFTFLAEFETQVDARVKIERATKTVAGSQLWYEESLPAESVLAGYVWCDRVFDKDAGKNGGKSITESDLLKTYCTGWRTLQIGGKASVGRGLVEMVFDQAAKGSGS